MQIERRIVARILDRLSAGPQLLQIIVGPRQVGKTTAALAVGKRWSGPVRHAAADLPLPPGPEWIRNHWELARRDAREGPALLILDEVQKVRGWSEAVKACWDEDRAVGREIRVLLLGSSALLLARGVTESLAGRFFLHRCLHWSWPECREAFGWDLDRWIFFGGYPGAAPLADDQAAWQSYVLDSLIETVLSRDVLSLQTVAKPALLRNLFAFAASHPAQIISYNKMLGELQDAGNTTTLAHYLRLLTSAFLISGLERFSAGQARTRGSSPKLVPWNNALISALRLQPFVEARSLHDAWGRLVENAVGAHLLNHLQGLPYEVTYWRDRNAEVDFVVRSPRGLWAIEVKSGRPRKAQGIEMFLRRHPKARSLLLGPGGMPLEEFFSLDPSELFV
ncbi:MAG: ATP-binding protein [Candidatus Eisenbacteria bacterium]|nr:ATP-binding protein [Candidatus Eisenbacteria bacterium]